MALKAVLDNLDGLGDDIKGEYVEKDGKFHLQVEGMKSEADFNRVNTALGAERRDHAATKQKFTVFGDKKPEDILAQLDRIPELEAAAAGKLDDAKINEIVETRIKTRIAPVERERDTLKTALAEKDKVIEGFTTDKRTRTIHDEVRAAAKKAKLLPEAEDDALLLADKVMEVNESGQVVVRDQVGYTPGIDATVWLTELQNKRPHWWGPSQGGGAGGNRGNGGGGGDNPWTHEHWNMTQQGKILQENRSRAEQLAKSAGTTIGGQRPPAKK